MNTEFKLPIKNVWQQANQPLVDGDAVVLPYMKSVAAAVAPTFVPSKIGLLCRHEDITNPLLPVYNFFLSINTSSASDWRIIT